jgi:hypothetical protein
MRMVARPRQTVPPHQHVPSSWMFRMVSRVDSSDPNDTGTWFSTTSFRISNPLHVAYAQTELPDGKCGRPSATPERPR